MPSPSTAVAYGTISSSWSECNLINILKQSPYSFKKTPQSYDTSFDEPILWIYVALQKNGQNNFLKNDNWYYLYTFK